LAGSIYVRSHIKFLRFVLFGLQIWLSRAILVSDWLMLNKYLWLKKKNYLLMNHWSEHNGRSVMMQYIPTKSHTCGVTFGCWLRLLSGI
jgi:hypothetical protein